MDKRTLTIHLKTKAHKKRVKELRLTPHTHEEAERAAGKGNFIMPTERVVRDMTADDQVRDTGYVQEQQDKQIKKVIESMADPQEPKKKKETLFLPVKSKKDPNDMET